MRCPIALAVAALLSSASSALAQTAPQPPEAFRLSGARSATPTGPGRLEEVRGVLISDPVAREIRLESDGREVFRLPYDRIVALHSERAGYPRRWLRLASFYLVVHYTARDGTPAAETIRILSERDALDATAVLGRHTGLGVERSTAFQSFLGVPIRARIGTRLAVTDATGTAVQGTLASLSPTSITLTGLEGGDHTFDADGIRRIRLLYSPRRDALKGFSLGAAFTVFSVWLSAGLSGCYNEGDSDCPVAKAMIGGAAIGGGIGALVSTTFGAMRYPFNQAFDVFRADPARASRGPALGLAPQLGVSRGAVVLTLSY